MGIVPNILIANCNIKGRRLLQIKQHDFQWDKMVIYCEPRSTGHLYTHYIVIGSWPWLVNFIAETVTARSFCCDRFNVQLIHFIGLSSTICLMSLPCRVSFGLLNTAFSSEIHFANGMYIDSFSCLVIPEMKYFLSKWNAGVD